jgi:chromosome segregation ATPase
MAGNTLANLNRNCFHGLGPKPAKAKKLDGKLDLKRQKTKSALKDLTDLETKLAKLGELSDKSGLKVSKLQIALNANKKAAFADLSLQKKIHKKELMVKTNLALSQVKAQINILKDVESSKKTLQKKFDARSKTLYLLQKAFAESKRHSLDLSADIVSASKAKDSCKDNIKVLNKTIKSLKSKVNNQLVQKNDHDFRMQKMKNNYKQMVGRALREAHKQKGRWHIQWTNEPRRKERFRYPPSFCEAGKQGQQSCSSLPEKIN